MVAAWCQTVLSPRVSLSLLAGTVLIVIGCVFFGWTGYQYSSNDVTNTFGGFGGTCQTGACYTSTLTCYSTSRLSNSLSLTAATVDSLVLLSWLFTVYMNGFGKLSIVRHIVAAFITLADLGLSHFTNQVYKSNGASSPSQSGYFCTCVCSGSTATSCSCLPVDMARAAIGGIGAALVLCGVAYIIAGFIDARLGGDSAQGKPLSPSNSDQQLVNPGMQMQMAPMPVYNMQQQGYPHNAGYPSNVGYAAPTKV